MNRIPSDAVQIIKKGELKYALSQTDSLIAEVKPGEIFEVETELNIGGHLIHFTFCEPGHRSNSSERCEAWRYASY
jgi:hypothetical protein